MLVQQVMEREAARDTQRGGREGETEETEKLWRGRVQHGGEVFTMRAGRELEPRGKQGKKEVAAILSDVERKTLTSRFTNRRTQSRDSTAWANYGCHGTK